MPNWKNLIRERWPDSRELDRLLEESLRGVGEDAELILQAHAPTETGRLGRSIRAEWVGGQVLVTANARDPQTGFDYVAVTRFGHKVAYIEPKARGRATVLATGRARKRGKQATLRFVIGGRVFYRRRVKGYKPGFDWRDRALPEINEVSQRAMATLGRRIVTARG